MRWISPSVGRTFFVLDNGRIAVEFMHGSDGVTQIVSVDAGSPEFRMRLCPKSGGLRFINLDAAKDYIEHEWTVDGDSEAMPDNDYIKVEDRYLP